MRLAISGDVGSQLGPHTATAKEAQKGGAASTARLLAPMASLCVTIIVIGFPTIGVNGQQDGGSGLFRTVCSKLSICFLAFSFHTIANALLFSSITNTTQVSENESTSSRYSSFLLLLSFASYPRLFFLLFPVCLIKDIGACRN